jgi:hypothetical protein
MAAPVITQAGEMDVKAVIDAVAAIYVQFHLPHNLLYDK